MSITITRLSRHYIRNLLCITILFWVSCSTDLPDPEKKTDNSEVSDKEPRLLSFSFMSKDNPLLLVEDVKGEIVGDSIVECWIQNIVSDKLLVSHFEYTGERVTIEHIPVKSDETEVQFKTPVRLTVSGQGKSKDYTIYVHSFTGLPVLWIETEDRAEITSKEVYTNAHLRLVENVRTRSAGEVTEADMMIKGRGNSTWSMPKKPYAIKFEKGCSLVDEPEDKSWVLLANYTDKTSLRNQTAFYMGSISNLDYTPRFHYVELILNGQYNGTYQLGDKLKTGKNRVNVGSDGFLLEIDAYATAEEVTFKTSHLERPVNIKEPDVEEGDENFDYIKNYVIAAENALFGNDFRDPDKGWQKYMDMDSFVDWYLVNEIAKNNDGYLWSSCYMNLKRGGKLKMGPLWDFDLAFGNVDYSICHFSDGFYIKSVSWYARLFEDPAFVAKVKERFDYFYNRKNDILNEINANAQYLRYSVQENNNKWKTFYTHTWPNYNIWGNYQNEVQSMKEWLNARFEWLKTEFDKM